MSILEKFETLADQAVFLSNKHSILKSLSLLDTFEAGNSQKIRIFLSSGSEQFSDMSRVVDNKDL